MNRFSKSSVLVDVERLKKSKVTVIGLGGVGSIAAETLVRTGVGNLVLVDFDKIETDNLNRQIMTLSSNVGKFKTEVLKKRFLDINPDLNIEIFTERAEKGNFIKFIAGSDFVIDAIDSLSDKADLIEFLVINNYPFISSMGTALRHNPAKLKIIDFSETHSDPLSKRLRKILKKRGITRGFDVVFSEELPQKNAQNVLGSLMYVTSVAGLYCAYYVIEKLS